MATYRYKCPSCSHEFDVIKRICECDSLESCPSCKRGNIEGKNRLLAPLVFFGEKQDDAFFSVSIGKVVKSRKEERSIAKSKGWEEIGSTDIKKHIETDESSREKRSKDRYREFFDPIEING